MTPLSDALTAAQRSALAALEKAYVAEQIDDVDMIAKLQGVGISDPVDTAFLLASLDVLREWGVAAPNMTERITDAAAKQATEGQVSYIIDLLKKGGHGPLAEGDLRGMSFERASTLIDELKKGTYDESRWDVPF
jgi:hypothetical protein